MTCPKCRCPECRKVELNRVLNAARQRAVPRETDSADQQNAAVIRDNCEREQWRDTVEDRR